MRICSTMPKRLLALRPARPAPSRAPTTTGAALGLSVRRDSGTPYLLCPVEGHAVSELRVVAHRHRYLEGYTKTHTYHTMGNIRSRVRGGVTWTYNYDNAAHKHAVSSLSGGTTASYYYDANGNLTSNSGTYSRSYVCP